MADTTGIAWCDATFNPWVGCSKISPGCDHCYAEGWAKRSGMVKWGEARRRTSAANWKQPLKWERKAAAAGVRRRVFCASLADVFDNWVPDDWRYDLWSLIRATPHLDWLLLTKRIGNAKGMLPIDWGRGYPNVGLGASIVNQPEADRDIVKLLATPARMRFLSMEPLLEEVDITAHLWGRDPLCADCPKDIDCDCAFWTRKNNHQPSIDWVICGGESGHHARPMEWEWAQSLNRQCAEGGVAFFMKQGSQATSPQFKDFESFPQSLQVRQWPQ